MILQYTLHSRAWYKRAESAPSKTSISTAYMDAAGVGKIITISQALFEGMTPRTTEECIAFAKTGPLPGGCVCSKDEDCIIGEIIENRFNRTNKTLSCTSRSMVLTMITDITIHHRPLPSPSPTVISHHHHPSPSPTVITITHHHHQPSSPLPITISNHQIADIYSALCVFQDDESVTKAIRQFRMEYRQGQKDLLNTMLNKVTAHNISGAVS